MRENRTDPMPQPARFYTIGHSTRPLAEFAELLAQSRVDLVADVRTVPRSRKNPQYNADTLPESLAHYGVAYRRIASLGGLRGRQKGVAPELNGFWSNASFHNYADYATTAPFREGLAALRALGQDHRCAIMCAEAVWWRCHRRIIADYLLHEGCAVFHILGSDHVAPARLTEAAKPGPDGALVYPLDPGAPRPAPA